MCRKLIRFLCMAQLLSGNAKLLIHGQVADQALHRNRWSASADLPIDLCSLTLSQLLTFVYV